MAVGRGCHASPVVYNFQHQSSSHGTGEVGRPIAPLENVASLTTTATHYGSVSSQGFSYQGAVVGGLHEPEPFARASRNGEALSSNGAQLLSTAAAQLSPSPRQAFLPAGHVYVKNISAAEVVKHQRQSKSTALGLVVEEDRVLDREYGMMICSSFFLCAGAAAMHNACRNSCRICDVVIQISCNVG